MRVQSLSIFESNATSLKPSPAQKLQSAATAEFLFSTPMGSVLALGGIDGVSLRALLDQVDHGPDHQRALLVRIESASAAEEIVERVIDLLADIALRLWPLWFTDISFAECTLWAAQPHASSHGKPPKRAAHARAKPGRIGLGSATQDEALSIGASSFAQLGTELFECYMRKLAGLVGADVSLLEERVAMAAHSSRALMTNKRAPSLRSCSACMRMTSLATSCDKAVGII
jgi:hypothetical protein